MGLRIGGWARPPTEENIQLATQSLMDHVCKYVYVSGWLQVSYDGRLAIHQVPSEDKYRILLV